MPFDPTLILIALFAVVLLWWLPRTAKKQQAAATAFRDNLEPGQEVMTIGRMYGTVVEVDGNRVTLDLGDGALGVWDKDGILRLVEPPLDDELVDDDELDEVEDEDEAFEDDVEDDELDDEDLDDEAIDDEPGEEAEPAGALVAGDEAEWTDVEVPDDASSLTDPDEDDKKPR